jgi:hypothetical protein
MSDLPEERLKSCPPFTYVGVDCFGPWDIVTRRTRGGSTIKRRNALIKDEVLISSMTSM